MEDIEIVKFDQTDTKERTSREINAINILKSQNIAYTIANHPETATIESCHEVEMLLGCEICKNLFLCNSQKTNFYLLLMPGDKPFRTKDLSHEIGTARLSFAPHEFMEEFLLCAPGSASFMGIFNDNDNRVRLLIDKELLTKEYFACHPCKNTSTVKFRTDELLEKLIPICRHEPTFVHLPRYENI